MLRCRIPRSIQRVQARRRRPTAEARGNRHGLIHRGLSGVESGRILQSIPRNIGHLKQTQLLALINIGGAGQTKLHQRGGTGTAGAELAVFGICGAVAQPVVRQLVVGRALDLRQTVAGGLRGTS